MVQWWGWFFFKIRNPTSILPQNHDFSSMMMGKKNCHSGQIYKGSKFWQILYSVEVFGQVNQVPSGDIFDILICQLPPCYARQSAGNKYRVDDYRNAFLVNDNNFNF